MDTALWVSRWTFVQKKFTSSDYFHFFFLKKYKKNFIKMEEQFTFLGFNLGFWRGNNSSSIRHIQVKYTSEYRKPRKITPLPSDNKLGKHPSWNIAHIPRGHFLRSARRRPSGCVRYFTRDVSLVHYRAIFNGILSLEASPLVTKYR